MRTTTLYRPVDTKELALIEASGFTAFPPRLPEQPIFYPVANEAYARQIARDWTRSMRRTAAATSLASRSMRTTSAASSAGRRRARARGILDTGRGSRPVQSGDQRQDRRHRPLS